MTRSGSRVQAGWTLIAIGALFSLDRLAWDWGWSWRPTVRELWPVILIVVGLAKLSSPVNDVGGVGRRSRRQLVSGGWIVLIGVMMLLDQNGWLYLSESWPFFIIAAGVSLLLARRHTDREGT